MSVFAFYLFSIAAIAGGFFTVTSRQPVHSVLWLILAFISSAGLFVLLGAEFVAMLLVIVYVGAVAVLFLFVVMMLDVDFAELRQGFLQYVPIGAMIGVIFLVELLLVLTTWAFAPETAASAQVPIPNDMSNAAAIGQLMYTKYVLFFQLAGMVLLVAMVGAIVLTLRHKAGIKRQDISVQVARTPATAIEVRKVESGKGI